MARVSMVLVGAMLIAGCNATPLPGDPFPACDAGQPVYLPPPQAPDEFETSSIEGMECFADAHKASTEADLTFVLLGTEGGGFDAMLRTHSDATFPVSFLSPTANSYNPSSPLPGRATSQDTMSESASALPALSQSPQHVAGRHPSQHASTVNGQ